MFFPEFELQLEYGLLGTSRVGNWSEWDPKLHMSRVNSVLELTDVRNSWKREFASNKIRSTFFFINKMFLKTQNLSGSMFLLTGFLCCHNYFRREKNERALGGYINNNYKIVIKKSIKMTSSSKQKHRK